MIAALKEGRTVAMSEHEVRSPLDVITAGRALLELAAGDFHGIFHLAGHNRVNRFGMAQLIAARFGFPKDLVLVQSPHQIGVGEGEKPARAARPRDVSLTNRKVCAELKTPMR